MFSFGRVFIGGLPTGKLMGQAAKDIVERTFPTLADELSFRWAQKRVRTKRSAFSVSVPMIIGNCGESQAVVGS